MRLRALLILSLLAVLPLAACSDDGDDPLEDGALSVRIGVVQSLTGAGSPYGPSAVDGIELALEDLAEQHPDWTVEHIVLDDGSTPDGGLEAYRDLVEQDVDVIIGPSLSTVGFEVLEYMQEQSLPAITPITTAAGISAIGDYIFRIALSEDIALPPLVERVAADAPIESVVIVFHSEDAYSRAAAEAMRAGATAIGASVAAEFDLAAAPALEEVLADPAVQDADAFFLPLLVDQAGPVLEALAAAGNEKPVLGGEALAAEGIVELVGDAVNGMYVASTWHHDAPDENSRAFVEAYRARFNHDPEYYAAAAYAGVEVLFDALERAGSTDPEALRDALAATADLETVLGPLSMSDQGDALFDPVIQRFEDGRLVLVD